MSSQSQILQPTGASDATRPVDMSVVVPVTERPVDLAAIWTEYSAPLRELGLPFEFIFMVEPEFWDLAERLATTVRREPGVRILVAGQIVGESELVKLALEHCNGDRVLLLPAYHRVEADAIPRLIRRLEDGVDMVVARRWPRRDSWINRVQHGALHALVTPLAGGRIHDVGCGMQVVRREVLADVPLYGDLYRFLPLIVHREGFRVVEEDAPQHSADGHTRIYGPGIYLRRLIDLLGLYFLLRFTDKPLRFFGLAGSVVSLAGAAVLAVLFLQRVAGQGIADRPLLVLGVMLVVLGVQAIALGLVGEIIVHMGAAGRRPYRLARAASVPSAEPFPPSKGGVDGEEREGGGEGAEAVGAALKPVQAGAYGSERS